MKDGSHAPYADDDRIAERDMAQIEAHLRYAFALAHRNRARFLAYLVSMALEEVQNRRAKLIERLKSTSGRSRCA